MTVVSTFQQLLEHLPFDTYPSGSTDGALLPSSLPGAQRLPAEILDMIMPYLRTYTPRDMVIFSDEIQHLHLVSYPEGTTVSMGSLPHVAKVCKSWYYAATTEMYTCPYLTSLEAVVLFSRTLKVRPQICENVKELLLYTSRQGVDTEEPAPNGILKYFKKSAKPPLQELKTILRSCTSLKQLYLRSLYSDASSGVLYSTEISDAIGERPLEKLTVYSEMLFLHVYNPDASAPYNVSLFTHLHTLCLINDFGPVMGKRYKFPILPRLRTLQLTGGGPSWSHWFSDYELDQMVSPSTTPLLEALELYHSPYPGKFTKTVSQNPNLRRIYIIGGNSMPYFTSLMAANATHSSNLTSLAIGPVTSNDLEHIETWSFPPSLKDLTILIAMPPNLPAELSDVDERLIVAINRCFAQIVPKSLKLNTLDLKFWTWTDARPRYPSLEHWFLRDVASIVEDMKTLYELNGTKFSATVESFDEWITSMLAQ